MQRKQGKVDAKFNKFASLELEMQMEMMSHIV